MRVGVISDTHGHFASDALAALAGVELILHAGDIGGRPIVDALEAIAPLVAVHGNTDVGTPMGRDYPAAQRLEREGVRIFMTHIGGRPADLLRALPADPGQRPHVYIFGHTHVALCESHGGVLFLNPGAAGRPRFGGGVSLAILQLAAGQASAAIVPLKP